MLLSPPLLLFPHRASAVNCFRNSREECQDCELKRSLLLRFCLGRALAKTRALSLTNTSLLISKPSEAIVVTVAVVVAVVSEQLLLLFPFLGACRSSKSRTISKEVSASTSVVLSIVSSSLQELSPARFIDESRTRSCIKRPIGGNTSVHESFMITPAPIGVT